MPRQYGAPPSDDSKTKGGEKGYGRKDAPPAAKDSDPSPSSDVVIKFHKNAPTDTRPEDVHHTLGFGNAQAAPGDHNHRTSGTPLFDGVTITGAKGGNAAVASIVNLLVQWGAKDSTTA